MPSGPNLDVIVRVAPRARASVGRAIRHLGKRVERKLDIINGFTAQVPASSLGRLVQLDGVVTVTPDARGHLLSVDPTLS
jgi:hypothetical protein